MAEKRHNKQISHFIANSIGKQDAKSSYLPSKLWKGRKIPCAQKQNKIGDSDMIKSEQERCAF